MAGFSDIISQVEKAAAAEAGRMAEAIAAEMGAVESAAMAWLSAVRPEIDLLKLHADSQHAIAWDEAKKLATGFLAMFKAVHVPCPNCAAAAQPSNNPQPAPKKAKGGSTVDPAETDSANAAAEAAPATQE